MHIQQLKYKSESVALTIADWHIEKGEHWGIFAAHNNAASVLVRILCGDIAASQGKIDDLPSSVACVSLAYQQALLENEIANDDTDFMDRIDYGSSVEQLILDAGCSPAELETLLADTDLLALRQRGFRQLSTGETRRLMLARALATKPQLLILDEPYSGLDVAHRQRLSALLERCRKESQLLIITSREDELPEFITHVALFDEKKLSQTLTREQWLNHPLREQIQLLSARRSDALLDILTQQASSNEYPNPLVELKDGKVEYLDTTIFKHVNWTIKRGEHWQIRGPNGCGKSTLLGLILGDHPQCYSNDIQVLGIKRGSGESIWEVKKNIGIVSSALHLQYRVNCSALDVLLSGFFDSIGLYQNPSTKQIQLARQWLSILEMAHLEKIGFRSLDYGQQRLLLIARALIKQPALLILDEPYQGLDYLNRKLVFQALNRIAEAQISQLLYVTHHEEDSLSAIKNFVDFIPLPQGGHQVRISHAA